VKSDIVQNKKKKTLLKKKLQIKWKQRLWSRSSVWTWGDSTNRNEI